MQNLVLLAELSGWHIAGALIAFIIGSSILRSLLYPDQEMDFRDLPEEARSLIEKLTSGFQPEQTIVSFAGKDLPRKYIIRGTIHEKPIKIQVEPNRTQDHIKEIEIDYETDVSRRILKNVQRIDPQILETQARDALHERLGVLGNNLRTTRAKGGLINGVDAYDIDGFVGEWEFEIKILSDGEILELEMDLRNSH